MRRGPLVALTMNLTLRVPWNGLILLALFLTACGGDNSALDPEQRFAYEIKPAVVRVNAYATARFAYPSKEIREIEKSIITSVPKAVVLRLTGIDKEEIETGTGGSGSGFIIHPSGYILTTARVARQVTNRKAAERELKRNGAVNALVRHFSAEPLRQLAKENKLQPLIERLSRAGDLRDVTFVEDVELANGERYGFEARTSTSEDIDALILRIRRPNLPTVRLGDSTPLRVDDQLWVVGYPAVTSVRDEVVGGWMLKDTDLEATFNPGGIESLKKDADGDSLFRTNAAIYHGNSGGPAVSRGDGSVVGIAVLGAGSGESSKSLIPIDPVVKLIRDGGVSTTGGGEFQANFSRALDLISKGRIVEAKGDLAFASQLFPNYPDLIRLQAEADRAEQSSGPLGGNGVLVGVLSVAVILFAGLAAFFASRTSITFEVPMIPPITRDTFVSPISRDGSDRVPERGEILGKLTILSGERSGERIGLGGSGIRVGREPSMCEIVLDNPKVSRLHAEFVEKDNRVLLLDRNSANGTFVNDTKIDKRFLKDGDIIYFGGRNAIAVAFNA